jgi:hypothetical protein
VVEPDIHLGIKHTVQGSHAVQAKGQQPHMRCFLQQHKALHISSHAPGTGTGKSTVLREVWAYLQQRITYVETNHPVLYQNWQRRGLDLLKQRLQCWDGTGSPVWVFSADFSEDSSGLPTVQQRGHVLLLL